MCVILSSLLPNHQHHHELLTQRPWLPCVVHHITGTCWSQLQRRGFMSCHCSGTGNRTTDSSDGASSSRSPGCVHSWFAQCHTGGVSQQHEHMTQFYGGGRAERLS